MTRARTILAVTGGRSPVPPKPLGAAAGGLPFCGDRARVAHRMTFSTSAAAAPAGSLRQGLTRRRRTSPAQLAAQAKFAATWGGTDGLIATKATPTKGS